MYKSLQDKLRAFHEVCHKQSEFRLPKYEYRKCYDYHSFEKRT